MAANCNYKVKLIGALDMLRFKNMPKVREAAIQAAPAAPLPTTLPANERARVRHPEAGSNPGRYQVHRLLFPL